MIRETISKIEAKLHHAESLGSETRRELIQLLGTLKTEVTELSKTNAEKARSIAVFAETSANEAISGQKNPELLKLSVQDLSASVDGFEQSHPELVQIVNRICTTLSNLGI